MSSTGLGMEEWLTPSLSPLSSQWLALCALWTPLCIMRDFHTFYLYFAFYFYCCSLFGAQGLPCSPWIRKGSVSSFMASPPHRSLVTETSTLTGSLGSQGLSRESFPQTNALSLSCTPSPLCICTQDCNSNKALKGHGINNCFLSKSGATVLIIMLPQL